MRFSLFRSAWLLLPLGTLCVGQSSGRQDGLRISPSKVDFGLQGVNSQSAATQISIHNVSTAPVHFNQITTSGIDFHGTNNCGAELAIDAECTIQVTFTPAIAGDRMGAIIIAASDPESPHYVPLAGTGE